MRFARSLPTPPAGLVDAVLAGAVTVATVAPTLLPTPAPWWVVLSAVASGVPLLWRRRAPVPVSVVSGLAMTAMVLWEKPFLPWGPLLGVYTVAELSGTTVRLLAAPVVGIAVYVSLAVPHEESEVYRMVGTAFVAAWALGAGARARAARLAERAERGRRVELERAAAAALERTRIARDVHDVVTHSVGLMVVQAEAGSAVLGSDPRQAQAALDAVADTGRTALVQLRGLLDTLRRDDRHDADPPGHPPPGLDTLPGLIDRTRRAGLEVTLETGDGPHPVPRETAVAAYRIVQEALTNVIRHARARHAHVAVTCADDLLTVTVTDDGAGAGPGGPGGHGLAGMRERVAACGGTLRAGTAPGGTGFVVHAELPLP
ncbi:sensor histidine kinase [Nonomuraea sp. NPDC004354]